MELFYLLGICVMLFPRSADAVVAFTDPPPIGTAACSALGSVAEGTTTGTVVSSALTGGVGPFIYSLKGADAYHFALSAEGVITIAATAVLDFESGPSYTVQVEVTDIGDSDTVAEGTCTVAVTDVAVSAISGYAKYVMVPENANNGYSITTIQCTDGADLDPTALAYFITAGDDAAGSEKFEISNAGAISKTANAFDTATKSQYILTATCADATGTQTATVTVCVGYDCSSTCSKASINKGILAGLIIPTLLTMYQLL